MSKLTRVLMGCIAAGALSVSANAADLPMKAMPAPVAPMWNWSGFYAGVNVGAGFGTTETTLSSVTIPPAPAFAIGLPLAQNSTSGIVGGMQAGYNWQSGWAVLGVEGTFSGMDVKGTTPCVVIFSCSEKSNWLATASARLGAVVLDRGLVYVKGGAAWQNTRTSIALPGILGGLLGGVGDVVNGTHTNVGWLVGMGTEWAITKNWTAFVEYDYMNFQKKTDAFPIVPFPAVAVNLDVKSTLSVAKVGVNYKFDWATPVVAKY